MPPTEVVPRASLARPQHEGGFFVVQFAGLTWWRGLGRPGTLWVPPQKNPFPARSGGSAAGSGGKESDFGGLAALQPSPPQEERVSPAIQRRNMMRVSQLFGETLREAPADVD